MNDRYAGGSRTAEDRPDEAGGPGGPGGWWRADDGYWYPPSTPAPDSAGNGNGADPTTAALQAAANRWAAAPTPEAGGDGDPITSPVTMVERGWGGGGDGEAPRAAGMADIYRSWPAWARIGGPIAAAFIALMILAGTVGAIAGTPEESDSTETSASEPTTTAEPSTTTSRPTTTTASTTTTAPPTTTTTAPPATTAPPTTAAPPPPPTTAAPPATVATAPPQPACHPSYSGCVPMASDVDCAGGSGDGPEYVSGPVQVVGNDEYGLDNDNDGVGCEP